MLKLFEIVYILSTIFTFFSGKSIFNTFIKSAILFIISFVCLCLLIIKLKFYILIGFSIAFCVAVIYTVTHITEESAKIMDQAGVDFIGILITCLISIFFWPQFISINVCSMINSDIK
jgi:hypothetical protein